MKKNLLIITVILFCIFMTGCSRSEPTNERMAFSTDKMGYTDEGFVFTRGDNILRYFDIGSGMETVLCARPDCRHKPIEEGRDRECYADYQGGVDAAFIYDGRLYVIAPRIDENGYAGDFLNKTLYVSEAGGTNRRSLAELENVGNILSCTVNDNYLAVTSYIDLDSIVIIGATEADEELRSSLPERCAAVTIIDLGNGKTARLQYERGFGITANTPYVENGSVTFKLSYITEDIFSGLDEKIGEMTEEELDAAMFELNEKMKDYMAAELVRYDIKSGTEETIWSGASVAAVDYGHALTSDERARYYVVDLSDANAEALDEKFNGYSGVICDTGIMLYKYESGVNSYPAFFYDFETKKVSESGEYPAGCSINGVTDNIVYILCFEDNGDQFYGWVDKADFFSGKIDSTDKINQLGGFYEFN
ncbi:MAG: hypothetical protein HDT43_08965 [Ruminococcaceae bacterium]|nr:hypothetical protein [Oscillospiraceae bacterium]